MPTVYLVVFVPPCSLMDSDLKNENASPTLAGFPAVHPSGENESSVKETEDKTPAGQPIVDREKVCQTSHVTAATGLNTLSHVDCAVSHTRICQSWLISPAVPIPRRPSSSRR
jgi:hypothetical protein